MRPGVRLGIDVGTVRIGVARSDSTPMLAVPLETVMRSGNDAHAGDDIRSLARLAEEYGAVEIVVGLPLNLQGSHTPSTADSILIARLLAQRCAIPVRLLDERLTTVTASAGLRAAGKNSRSQRAIIDQQAAVVLLQHAIDSEKATGLPPGELVSGHPE